VEELQKFEAFGLLDLSNNKLTWNELLKLKHITILDLRVFGNPELSELCFLNV
jgi:hypothetical protein